MSQNHLPAYSFSVDFGTGDQPMLEVSGLDLFIEPIYHREGSNRINGFTITPGLRSQSKVTLKRNLQKKNNDFFNWMQNETEDGVERRTVTITMLNGARIPEFIWRLRSAFPVGYLGPVMSSENNHFATESLSLVFEGLEMEVF